MGNVKDHLGFVEQNLQTLEDHVLEELESLKKAMTGQDELRTRFMELFVNLQEQLDVVKVGVEETRQETTMCKKAIVGGAVVTPSLRMDAPKPKEFGGKWDTKELDNFIWHMERYFEGASITDEKAKVRTATLYLTDTTTLWWLRKHNDIEKGLCTINTWDVFKKEIKRQFYPENVTHEARKKLRELKHKNSISDCKGRSPLAAQVTRSWNEQANVARSYLDEAARKMKKWANKRRRPRGYNLGDMVMLKLLPQQFKSLRKVHKGLIGRYEGPFPIMERRFPSLTVILKNGQSVVLDTYRCPNTSHVIGQLSFLQSPSPRQILIRVGHLFKVPRNRYWGLHPPPSPIENVIDEGLVAIQRAIFLRKAGVETALDDKFLLNPPSRADLLQSAIKNVIRYLRVSHGKDLTPLVREGVDTLLMYLYRALNLVDEMERLASSENSCVVEELEALLKDSGHLRALAFLYASKGMNSEALAIWRILARNYSPGYWKEPAGEHDLQEASTNARSGKFTAALEASRILEKSSDQDLILQHLGWTSELIIRRPLLQNDLYENASLFGANIRWDLQHVGLKNAFIHKDLGRSICGDSLVGDTMFVKCSNWKITVLIAYVDDIFVISDDVDKVATIKAYLCTEFKIKCFS
ncbi:hypothetical protein RJ639_029938 [Escallonia herrerae]|uniref:Uncharacterized protein n=1 Tax=Escallonia herrerae TaxID=1293975 RepID=A0AA89BML6_9ASTE|nr:hypothetical protein RJ639_029938 [Escallonia herrerae]